jgi:hypothetical protein
MIIRIRLNKWQKFDASRLRTAALAMAALLTSFALLAFTMAAWIIASDLHWTADFFLSSGFFSHWQVWLCTAAALLLVARLLERFAHASDDYTLSEEGV